MSDNGNRRLQYLVIAIVALVLATILLHYAHSQNVPDMQGISECEQVRLENFELKRQILQLTNAQLHAQSVEYINSLFIRYQIDRVKFELRNGKFHAILPLPEKSQ